MKPVVLVILDGWGHSDEQRGNAIALAQTPTIDKLERDFPSMLLQASGITVGLPWEEPGNSEVGHMSMGTGQVRYEPVMRISLHIKKGTFFENPVLLQAIDHVKKFSSSLHLMGLLGSGSVHSYLDHLYALLELAQKQNVSRIFLHLFLDGRDSPPAQGAELVDRLERYLAQTGAGRISTLIGRHYAMDRDSRWERTAKAYQLMTEGRGLVTTDPVVSIKHQYSKGITDELIEPILVTEESKESDETPKGLIQENDAVIFFNFREDRARQLSYAFVSPAKVKGFTPKTFQNLFFVTMIQYQKGLGTHVAFPKKLVANTLSKIIASAGKKQFKIAETEKYAHVTYFFNGGDEKKAKGEIRKLVPSLGVKSYAQAPWMSAAEIRKELIEALKGGRYDFLLANFANPDMLAHTGDLKATIKGVEVVDHELGLVVDEVLSQDGVIVITADHGNAEYMIDLVSGKVLTEHTANPVPFWLVANKFRKESGPPVPDYKKEIGGILPDVSATVLDLLGLPVPSYMDGESLLSRLGAPS